MTHVAFFLIVMLCLPGRPAGAQESDVAAQRAPQANDTLVKVAERPLHTGISTVVEELTMGVRDGAAEYAFGPIADIAVGPDGAMLVLEAALRGTPSLRLYDARGVFLREVGRRGEGPGEFRSPSAVAATPDGNFLLLDRMNRRITVYASTGEYVDSWSVPHFNTITGAPAAMRVGSAGDITIRIGSTQPPGSATTLVEAVVRLRTGGIVIDTLPGPRLPHVLQSITVTSQRNGVPLTARLVVPYSANALWQWSPLGYFVTGVSSRYAVDLRLPGRQREQGGSPAVWRSGDPVLSIRRPVPPVGVTSAERADQRGHLQQQLRALQGAQSRRLPDIPRVKPFYRWFFVGDEGRIWVLVHTQSQRQTGAQRPPGSDATSQPVRWREPALFDVFEPSGTYVGRVQVPTDLRFLRFRGDRIWAVASDELGVQYVKRYRVQWNAGR